MTTEHCIQDNTLAVIDSYQDPGRNNISNVVDRRACAIKSKVEKPRSFLGSLVNSYGAKNHMIGLNLMPKKFDCAMWNNLNFVWLHSEQLQHVCRRSEDIRSRYR